MIPYLTPCALSLACLASLLQGALSFVGARRRAKTLMARGQKAALLSFSLTFLGLAALFDGSSLTFIPPHDFLLANLWVFLLTGYGAVMARALQRVPPEVKAYALATQGFLALGFLGLAVAAPQTVASLWLSPLFYLGSVGFSAVFSLAIAQLMTGFGIAAWAKTVRPWTLAAWSFLTLGLVLQSWQNYTLSGPRAWWVWNHESNAALMLWLAETALLHTLHATWRRGAFGRWAILLAITTFGLSLMGTSLVLLSLFIGGAFALYGKRNGKLPMTPMFKPLSRETIVLLNNLFLGTAVTALLTGCLFSADASYFVAILVPLFVPLVLLSLVGPFLRWHKAEAKPMRLPLGLAFIVALLSSFPLLYSEGFRLPILGIALGSGVLAATLAYVLKTKNLRGFAVAQGGLGLLLLGMGEAAYAVPLPEATPLLWLGGSLIALSGFIALRRKKPPFIGARDFDDDFDEKAPFYDEAEIH